MKYSAVVLSLAVGAFALPQEASSITSAPAAPSASLTPAQSCVASCDPSDVTCQAACVGVARPNSSQAVETNECAAKCDQGDGSPEDTQKFSDCVQACIYSLFPSSQTVPVPAAGSNAPSSAASAAASATGSGSGAASTGGSPSGTGSSEQTGSPSASGSAAQSSETGAANANSVHMVGAGLAGIMAFFAL